MPKTIDEVREYYQEHLSNWQEMTAPSGFDTYLAGFCYGEAGYKSADLLPTEKVCPECGGDCEIMDNNLGLWVDCQMCDTKGIIPTYYTPEQFKEIKGKPYPDDALVWMKPDIEGLEFIFQRYVHTKDLPGYITYIVQTAQPAPEADYRPEE